MIKNATKIIDDNDDWGALEYLLDSGRYQQMGGILYPYDEGQQETEDETALINFLCSEWDFGYQKDFPTGN